VNKIFMAFVTLLAALFLAPTVFGQEKDDHILWSPSTYIQSAKIQYQVYKRTKLRDDLYHCIDLLRESVDRYGRVPEFNYMLGTFFAEINAIDTMIVYFDSVEVFCRDSTIDPKLRANCYAKDNYTKKMANFRQEYWERAYNDAVNYLAQYDTVGAMRERTVNEDSLKLLDSLRTTAYKLARSDFETALMIKPRDTRSFDGLGALLERQGDFPAAVELFKKAMAIISDSLTKMDALVAKAEQEKDTKTADALSKKKSALAAENCPLVNKIAYAFISVPQWDSAVVWFEKSLECDPKDVNSMINLSVSYHNVGNQAKWYEYTEKVLAIQPDNTQFLFNAGMFWLIKMQDAAMEMSGIPDSLPGGQEKRVALEKQVTEYIGKSAEYFEKNLAAKPDDIDALKRLGFLYLLSENNEGAIEVLERVKSIDASDNDALDYLGRAYIKQGKTLEAIGPYEKILENDPGNIPAMERLIDLYQYNGMEDKANQMRTKVEEIKKL
jgi:tetratricopeptide (TPR) repeat protein